MCLDFGGGGGTFISIVGERSRLVPVVRGKRAKNKQTQCTLEHSRLLVCMGMGVMDVTNISGLLGPQMSTSQPPSPLYFHSYNASYLTG